MTVSSPNPEKEPSAPQEPSISGAAARLRPDIQYSPRELEHIIEGLLEGYRRAMPNADDRNVIGTGMSDSYRAAIGAAEDLVDVMRDRRGEPLEEVQSLSLARFTSRARAAVSSAEVEELSTYLQENFGYSVTRWMYDTALMRNAAVLSDHQVGRWLGVTNNGAGEPCTRDRGQEVMLEVVLENLSQNPHLTPSQAEMIFGAIRGEGKRYTFMPPFLKRYPGLLIPRHIEEIASDFVTFSKMDMESWEASSAMVNVVAEHLLPRNVLNSEMMLALARRLLMMSRAHIVALATHPRATSEVWCEMIDNAGKGHVGGDRGTLRLLLRIPRILDDRMAREAFMNNSATTMVSSTPNLAELAMAFPPEAVNEPLFRLAKANPEHCLNTIRSLPAETLAHVDIQLILGEIAATSTDSGIRLDAILLSGIGESLPASAPDTPAVRPASEGVGVRPQ